LYSSLAFETDWLPEDRPVITLCTAVALTLSIEDVSGVSCDIKWPNDLLVDGVKVAGILVEATGDAVVVGCGVNLWWPGAPLFAGAIFENDPGPDAVSTIARGWVDRLREMVDAGPGSWPRAEYLQRSSTIGEDVTWDRGSGVAIGIARGGGLIVDTGNAETVLTAGEVHTHQER
jgi:BirA family biotin operon repressor/biotin-[acetyl-CoA-carboxylase] ligase